MNDFAAAMAPKSDQINAQDLLGGDMTITITGVKVTPGTEQPVSISLEGYSKVWRPCKTTGRVLMAAWGADTAQYIGRKVQLYLYPKVKWGGMEVGGIRIRAISHIAEDLRIVLAESKQVRKPVTIKRLDHATPDAAPALSPQDALTKATEQANAGTATFRAWFNSDEGKACRATGALTPEAMLTLRDIATKADAAKLDEDRDEFGLPKLADDPITDRPTTATDTELSAQITREQAELDRAEREFMAARERGEA